MKDTGILLIHYYYPPIRSGGVLRNYFFSLEFARRFRNISLVTTNNRSRLDRENLEIPSSIHIAEAATFDYRTLLSWRSADNHFSEGQKENTLSRVFIKLQKSFPFFLVLGEGNLWYIWNAFRKADEIVRKGKIEIIYSSFGPYSDHIVAWMLKRKYPEISWVADFRDLQVEPLYKNVYFVGLQRWFEQRILSRADLITTVSKGLQDQLRQYGRPTLAVGRGVTLRALKSNQADLFTISYTGSLYQGYRDPCFFLFAVRDLLESGEIEADEIEIVYAGRDGHQFAEWIEQANLEALFINRGLISRAGVIELQNRSQMQLLLTSSTPSLGGVLTGKLFEYLESGNPILVMVKGSYDREFEDLMKQSNAGKVFYDPSEDSKMLKEYILELYHHWKETGGSRRALNKKYVSEHLTWERQVDRILENIERPQ